jgi:glycosyltransferase involved in cell wall biosynthesis
MTDAALRSNHGVAGQAVYRSVVVVIPTLDEEQSIAEVVQSLPRTIVSRVIVADGGSRDATTAQAKAAGAEVIQAGRGYGRACLMATMAAEGADIVVFMDGDGADDAASITRLVEPIRSGRYDFVIGSRARGNREPGSIAWHQLAAGRLAGWAMWLLYGAGYTDMCAFRAIRRDALLGLGMRELTYGWNLEMQMRAARAGLRILEIPVDYRRRRGGNSKVAGTLAGTIRAGARILATFARISIETSRRVIDVSGDGSNNRGRPVTLARDEGVAAGIGINGLPILALEPDLDRYYHDSVIGGPGAFVIAARSYETFADAILKKLIIEIAANDR